jgi:hypothetical protein
LKVVEGEKRPLFPGEPALWRYKRGAARLALKRFEAARADLTAATSPSAQPWVSGRAHAELARLALLTGNRDQARTLAAQSETLCRQGSDPPCMADARRLMRSASGQ